MLWAANGVAPERVQRLQAYSFDIRIKQAISWIGSNVLSFAYVCASAATAYRVQELRACACAARRLRDQFGRTAQRTASTHRYVPLIGPPITLGLLRPHVAAPAEACADGDELGLHVAAQLYAPTALPQPGFSAESAVGQKARISATHSRAFCPIGRWAERKPVRISATAGLSPRRYLAEILEWPLESDLHYGPSVGSA